MKEYLKQKIEAKRSLKKEIKRIDKVVNQLAEIQVEQCYLLEELKKDSWKTKFQKEHQKFKEYEKESKDIINTLQQELKELSK